MNFKFYATRRSTISVIVVAAISVIQITGVFGQRYISENAPGNTLADQVNFSSPVASALGEYVVNPAGLYTGVPEIGIPLYSIQLKDFVLPISLSYHAGGIRIDETPSNIGLGWTLIAGGVITRAVKDRADDVTIDQCNNRWFFTPGVNKPVIERDNPCGNGLLWALSEPANLNYDGLGSYNIDISNYEGVLNSSTAAMKLIKKFYGIGQYSGSNDIYMLPMADKEPDIYYFNFAGRTGQFVFDMTSGTPVIRTYPYQDLKIEHFTDGAKELSSFKITDEKGVEYTFSAIETTTQSYRANSVPQADDIYMDGAGLSYHVNQYEAGAGETGYRSSWFLTRIDTPLGDYLDFTYSSEAYEIVTRGPQQTGWFYMNPPSGAMTYNPNDLTSSQTNKGYYNCLKTNDMILKGQRLKEISNNNIKVEFLAPLQREDVTPSNNSTPGGVEGAYAISEMIVYNKICGEKRIKKIKFYQDYFLSDANEYINKYYPDYPDQYDILLNDSSRYYKRLRLRSVQEFGTDDTAHDPPYTFEYKYSDFTGNQAHKLPHRLSYQQDIWGYYNGASGNNTLIPSLYVYPDNYPLKDSRQFRLFRKSIFTGPEYYLPAGNRLPNPDLIDIGILTKIIYPTKGSTEYQFESHTFRDEGEDYSGGGLRIKRTIKHDEFGSAPDIIHDYYYINDDNTSSGCLVSLPVMAVRSFPNIFGLSANSEQAYKTYTVRYSQPQAPLSTTNGSFVGYRTVTEEIEGNGKTVYTFSMPASWQVENDIPVTSPSGVCDPAIDGHCDGLYQLTPVLDLFSTSVSSNLNPSNYDFSHNPAAPNTAPFPENPNYDWQRGHLLAEKVFDNNDDPVKEILYNYKNYFPDENASPVNVYGYKFSSHYPFLANVTAFPAAHVFRIAKYTVLTEVTKVLESKKEITYSTAGLDKKVTSETVYEYENTRLNQPTVTTFTDSRDREIANIKQYAHDLTGAELGSDVLLQEHMDGIPLRQITMLENVPTSKTEVTYVSSNGKPVAGTIMSYADGNTLSSKIHQEYDEYSNLQQSTPVYLEDENGTALVTGIPVGYLWGYSGTLPVAKIENYADVSDVLYVSFEEGDGNSAMDDCKSGHKSKTDGFNESLSGLANGFYVLSYWYKSGVDWIPYEQRVSVTAGSYQIDIPTTVQVDDIRFCPASALMTTYTYDPGIGMTSMTDANRTTVYYEYDAHNRLALIRDMHRNVVRVYSYHFKE